MGILAVVDTFLVYKIADARYNRKVAFISSTLFAVLPATWFLRRIILDSIALPFILLSILFAIYYAKSRVGNDVNFSGIPKNFLLILPSGIFLGLAIFVKMPIFTLIPLVVFILLQKNNTESENGTRPKTRHTDIRALAVWFIPVVLFPMIWPAYAVSIGQFADWMDGVIWQANRADRPFAPEIKTIFQRMDPVIIAVGAAGLVYAILKRDYFILLWAFPYMIFMYFVNWVYFYHMIPVIAVLAIGGTLFLNDMIRKIPYKFPSKIIMAVVFGGIIISGVINSTLLISQHLNDSNFKLAAFVTKNLPYKKEGANNDTAKVTLIAPNGAFILYWIPSYVFNKNFDFKWFEGRRNYVGVPIDTANYLMIIDWQMRKLFSGNSSKEHIKYVSHLYNNSGLIGVFYNNNTSFPDIKKYPYTNIRDDVTGDNLNFRGIQWSDRIEVKRNYSDNLIRDVNK